jgi:hypothetical protein
MIHPNGWTDFPYDYLDYHWTVDGEEVRARHYLDDREIPKVQVFVPFERFKGEAYAGVLAYLQRRFISGEFNFFGLTFGCR